jgi:hypothetical protein
MCTPVSLCLLCGSHVLLHPVLWLLVLRVWDLQGWLEGREELLRVQKVT